MKTKKIEDYLPKEIIREVREYFEEKVSNAEKTFELYNR